MNMSFGVAAAPVPPPAGEGGGGDLPPSSSAPSTAVPLVPPSFSLSSASFTFQGSSANPMPPPRPSFAPSSGFSFPGAQANPPPSSGPPSLTPPPLFPLSGAAPRFSYPGPPTNTSSIAPPSTPAVPPFSMPSGFSYQGPSGNPPPLSVVASGSPSFAISNSLVGFSGHSPGIHVRPPPAQMAIIGMPSTATSQAPQGQISGVQAATQPTQAQSMHGAGPSPPLQVLGTPPGQSSTSSSPQPLSLQGSAPATASHPGLQGSTTAAAPSATTPGTASISVSSGIGTSVETEETHAPMSHQSTPGGFPPHPVPIPPATQMRPSMPGTLPPPGMAVSPQVVSGATQPLQGQGTAGPASVPPTTVVPPPAMPPVQVFPGQMPVTTLSSPVGAVPARPGPMPPTSTTLPFVPPRPVYSTNPVAAPPLVPPGDLRVSISHALLPSVQRRA